MITCSEIRTYCHERVQASELWTSVSRWKIKYTIDRVATANKSVVAAVAEAGVLGIISS